MKKRILRITESELKAMIMQELNEIKKTEKKEINKHSKKEDSKKEDKTEKDKKEDKTEKKSITNKEIASLIDEIISHQTGYGVIPEAKFTNKKIHAGKITSNDLEDIINESLIEYYSLTENLNEAEYKGRKVKLGKIMRGDRKKYKVHVKNGKGNVVKVEFGDPNMEIKRDDPKRRKNFRARHNCKNPGPRWKARYWACRTWSSKPVSKMI